MEKAFLKTLEAAGIEFVRLLWCDNANLIRGKAVHRGALEKRLAYGVGISCAQQSIPALFDAVSPGSGFGPVGEVFLKPDWETFTPLPYAPEHARVMGDMTQKGKPWPCCPRDFLKRMIKEADSEGIEIQAAFENEFYLLYNNPDDPVDNTNFAQTQAMDMNQKIIGEIVESLLAQDISVEQYYPESGPGEQEISIGHTLPLRASDNQVAFRETVRAVAIDHGLTATFLPKIFLNRAGCGTHLHLSLWKNGKNITYSKKGEYRLSAVTGSFIAGLLEHVPGLMGITTPTTNSYRRILPHNWSGAFKCWGIDNREAAIRVLTTPDTAVPDHFEFKVVDATSNPYLALGAVIAAGLDGIRCGLKPAPPVDSDPGNLSVKELEVQQINPLPSRLERSIDLLEENKVLIKAMGKELAQAYLAVKRLELENMREAEFADELSLLLERY